MGSAFQVLNAGADHTIKQAGINASRTTQAARNRSEEVLAEARRTVQNANNRASLSLSEGQRLVQAANNQAASTNFELATLLQGTSNAYNKGLYDINVNLRNLQNDMREQARQGQLAVQREFNAGAIKVAEARQVLQDARNEAAAAGNDVALLSASLSNRRVLKRMGDEVNNLGDELGRVLDGATMGRFSDRLAYAEATGAAVAQVAALGVGGGSVDTFNTAMNVRQALAEEQANREIQARVSFENRKRGAVYDQGISSLDKLTSRAVLDRDAIVPEQDFTAVMDQRDYSAILLEQDNSAIFKQQDYSPVFDNQTFDVYSPNLDFTQYVDHKKMSGFQQVATFIGAGVATYFGGPQAGNAVFAASQGLNDAQNGDFAAAQKNFNTAFMGAVSGGQTWKAGATKASQGYGEAWGKNIFSNKSGATIK